MAVVLAANMP